MNRLRDHAALCTAGLLLIAVTKAAPAAPAPVPAALVPGGVTPINALPFQINTPGRYCLTQNLAGVAGSSGITVVTSSVEIDLNGFHMQGVPDALSGISSGPGIRVVNGTLFNWPESAVDIGTGSVVRDIRVRGLGGGDQGISVGAESRVERCTVRDMDVVGISAGERTTVVDCLVEADDTAQGVLAGAGSKVDSVTVVGGTVGIGAGGQSAVKHCSARDFSTTGIAVQDDSIVDSCRVAQPDRDAPGTPVGIELGARTRASGCSVVDVPHGVVLGSVATVERTTVGGAEIGIQAGPRSRVSDCAVVSCSELGVELGESARAYRTTVDDAAGDGIVTVGPRAVVEGCSVTGVLGNGIAIGEECIALHNQSSGNVGAGLLATGLRGRIEGNTLDSNGTGLVVQGVHNLSIGNRAASNGGADFSLPFGNPSGPTLSTSWFLQGSVPQANFSTPFP